MTWRVRCRNSMLNKSSTEKRFWAKVRKDRDGCWRWIAAVTRYGYGAFTVRSKYIRAHRYSWELHNGPIPEGLCVCHRCDNPGCVNPAHLFLGTFKDNAIDCSTKGRRQDQKGAKNNQVKLTVLDIRMIRRIWEKDCPVTQRRVAEWFGVDPSLISRIMRRKRWTYVTS